MFTDFSNAYNLQVTERKVEKENRTYLIMETDFEYIEIDFTNSTRCVEEKDFVIRLISDDLLEYYNCDNSIDKAYFLPTHMEGKLLKSLEENTVLNQLMDYYTPEMLSRFEMDEYISDKPKIKNGSKSNFSTSYFSVDYTGDMSNEEIKALHLEAGESLRKLIAHDDDEIAIGSIPKGFGLLDINTKVKLKDPRSVHCDFWKLDYNISNKTFQDLADNFGVIS